MTRVWQGWPRGILEGVDLAKPTVRDGLRLVAVLVALMWLTEIVDAIDSHRLDAYGIQPRDPDALSGILWAPFLHAGFGHLLGNTIPFALMGGAIALDGLRRIAVVTALVAVVGGLGTWLVAPAHTDHIGASGVVFGYAAYLVSRGLFSKRLAQLALGAVVLALWGGALLSGFAPHPGISWQGHVSGAVAGLLAARLLSGGTARRRAAPVT